MLLVSESGPAEKIRQKEEKLHFVLFFRGEGDHFDYTHAQKLLTLGCIEFRKSSAQRTFPSIYPSAFNP
jgi:hypothetical protein